MGFKNLRIFRLAPSWTCTADTLEAALEKQAFQPSSSRDMQSLGWIAPRDDSGLVYGQNGQYLITLRAAKKLLPTTVITKFAKARAKDLEEQKGFQQRWEARRVGKEGVSRGRSRWSAAKY